jgi:hypothetical protein
MDKTRSPLRILPLRFVLRSSGLDFPVFSGATWHGGLGMVLAQQSPTAFRCLYQTSQESRLYALLPQMESSLPIGDVFELRVTLFGPGVDHALAVTQAIAELGRLGMRPGGHYEMMAAKTIQPDDETIFMSEQQGFIAVPHALNVQDYLLSDAHSTNDCCIRFVTPLRVKEGNALLRNAPSYSQLLRRIFSRLDQLAHVANEMPPFDKILCEKIYAETEHVVIKSSKIASYRIERRSSRSAQQMQIDGLVGTVDYTGEMKYSLPWLKLGSITQLGGKTAFGFGGFEIEITGQV